MTVSAGALNGFVVNGFAINEAAIVHSLSGVMTSGFASTASPTRRATIDGRMHMQLIDTVTANRRVMAQGNTTLMLLSLMNASQRHSTRGRGGMALTGFNHMIRRRSAPANGRIELTDRVDPHARRAARPVGTISLSATLVHARRRQVTSGTGLIQFQHQVNMRAFAPIYGRGSISLEEIAVAVRRVGLPSAGLMELSGVVGATARRCINTSSVIALVASIRMPHYKMTPVDPYRSMLMYHEPRAISAPYRDDPIRVFDDRRGMNVAEEHRDIMIMRFEGES